MTRVAVIGNHSVAFTTETYLARAFEENGCDVVRVSQDDAFAMDWSDLANHLITADLDLTVYTRTHNRTALPWDYTETWAHLAGAGVTTASFHLDRFWDLEREHLITDDDRDPLFTTEHVFTADGGNDDRWSAAQVNHHWLPPAVDRYEAEEMRGTPIHRYNYDVIFVGSSDRTYHQQYPARGELLAHLRETYGSRFAHFGHGGDHPVVRQQDLNDVYASAKIVVGDSCFANDRTGRRSTNYWSDRIPETLGRGGFLLHPFVPGVRREYGASLATYTPGDWDDLDAQIGAYLANPGDRYGMVEQGRARVLKAHTYTHRAATILQTCGLKVGTDAEV